MMIADSRLRYYTGLLLLLVLLALTGCGGDSNNNDSNNNTETNTIDNVVPTEQAVAAAPTRAASATVAITPTTRASRTPAPTHTATRTASPTATHTATARVTATAVPPTATPPPTATVTIAPITATVTPAPPTATTAPPTSTTALATTTTALATTTAQPAAPATGTTANEVARPARVRIPKLGVDAAIEVVGQDEQGRMDVPDAVENVAWYSPGVAPGQMGNAVFSGHLDDYKQDPAVFWRLNDLEPGDIVTVVDVDGIERQFVVTGKEVYPYDQAPLARIFGASISADLNLITCNGIWNENAWNYDKRLVVYTTLLE